MKISWNGFWCVHFYVPRNFFVSRIRQTQIWKILKSPEMDFNVYIFIFWVNIFVSCILQTQIWKKKTRKFPEMDFDVFIFTFRVDFFVLRIRQTQIWKNTKISWNRFCCVHFYVPRKFLRFTYTPNANLKKYKNSLEWILMSTFLRSA